MHIPNWIPAVVLLGVLGSAGLLACDSQGPAEEAGESIDETVEDARNEAEDTYEEMTEDE